MKIEYPGLEFREIQHAIRVIHPHANPGSFMLIKPAGLPWTLTL